MERSVKEVTVCLEVPRGSAVDFEVVMAITRTVAVAIVPKL